TTLFRSEDIQFADFEEVVPQVELGDEDRISDELVLVFPRERALFPYHEEFLDRFEALSTVEELDDDGNVARLAAQSRADEDLLNRMLRVYGYYDALVRVFPRERALFPYHEEFLDRFEALSTVEELDDDGNVARLAAQSRADEDLLNRMLRVYGYYDALVFRSVGELTPGEDNTEQRPTVRFDIIPGTQYRFGAIDLGNLAAAGADYAMLRDTFEIQTGDPLLADKIVEE